MSLGSHWRKWVVTSAVPSRLPHSLVLRFPSIWGFCELLAYLKLMSSTTFYRPFRGADMAACLAIFDANCPEFFAPNERADYEIFLQALPEGYEVCEVAGRIVAAFGLIRIARDTERLNWIMLHPDSKGRGLGSEIMRRVVSLARASRSPLIRIAASHKSAPFFARFGAVAVASEQDGWGPGMDRIDMALPLQGS